MTSTRSAAATGLPKRCRAKRRLSLALSLPSGANARAVVEAQIEALIDLLDRLDPDPDLEENGDLEPSLGSQPPGIAYDAELDEAESGIGDLDGLWEQGHLAGRSLELLHQERREARTAAERATELVASLRGRAAARAVRS